VVDLDLWMLNLMGAPFYEVVGILLTKDLEGKFDPRLHRTGLPQIAGGGR